VVIVDPPTSHRDGPIFLNVRRRHGREPSREPVPGGLVVVPHLRRESSRSEEPQRHLERPIRHRHRPDMPVRSAAPAARTRRPGHPGPSCRPSSWGWPRGPGTRGDPTRRSGSRRPWTGGSDR
jgi:hypothetical protein